MKEIICELCEEQPAWAILKNEFNGNKLSVCCCCYRDIWGTEKARLEVSE